jgi:phage repressor protein C with HTH and peptisase S24 domain
VLVLPVQRVAVRGPSMVPVLRDGDTVLVRHGAPIRPGDVVLARFRAMPDRLVLKRTVRPVDGGWWLASDNSFAGGDSAVHGVADVLARVVLRIRRGEPRPWRSVRRVRAVPTGGEVADSLPRANPD